MNVYTKYVQFYSEISKNIDEEGASSVEHAPVF